MAWIQLTKTSPSGKTLFMCSHCGMQTPAPKGACPGVPATHKDDPIHGLSCAVLDQRIIRSLTKSVSYNALVRSSSLAAEIIDRDNDENRAARIRGDRLILLDLIRRSIASIASNGISIYRLMEHLSVIEKEIKLR